MWQWAEIQFFYFTCFYDFVVVVFVLILFLNTIDSFSFKPPATENIIHIGPA